MPAAAPLHLEANHAYRTKDFLAYGKNPGRLVRRLVDRGELRELAHGLYHVPVHSRFGVVPPRDHEILRGFLEDYAFVMTGPPAWNALALGATAMFTATLVYNRKRTGTFTFDGRTFLLRRVAFPDRPTAEWYVIDLIQHADMAGVGLDTLEHNLANAMAGGRFEQVQLVEMALHYGSKATQALVARCLTAAMRSS